jgi:large subunit ribosomal protein L35
MPKQKTRKSIIRRFRFTKNGKVMRRQAGRRHLKAGKSQKRLMNLKRTKRVTGFYAKKLRKATVR